MARYRVKAAMAIVKTNSAPTLTGPGRGLMHLYQGAIVPEDADPAHIRHLLDGQIIEPVDDGQIIELGDDGQGDEPIDDGQLDELLPAA